MLRCESCNNVSKPNQKTYTAILEERIKEYYKYILSKNHKNLILIDPSQKVLADYVNDSYKIVQKIVYKGTEIVKVKKICKNCISKFKKVL